MQFIGLHEAITQQAFADLIGVSGPAVSDLVRRGVLAPGQTGLVWLHRYCAHIREQAAGRAAGGDLNLATERAHLAREQRLLTEIKRRREERELAPVALMTTALARVSARVAATLDAIPSRVKRICPDVSAAALRAIEEEIAAARNAAADITLDLGESDADQDDEAGDPPGDQGRAEAA